MLVSQNKSSRMSQSLGSVAASVPTRQSKTMSDHDHRASIAAAIEKLPQWVRHDLSATDAIVRARAEETIAARIKAAIESDRLVEP